MEGKDVSDKGLSDMIGCCWSGNIIDLNHSTQLPRSRLHTTLDRLCATRRATTNGLSGIPHFFHARSSLAAPCEVASISSISDGRSDEQ